MKLSYKKGKLGKSLGHTTSSKKTFGNKPQSISLSESQFTRLMENFVLEQESAAFYDEIDAELAEEFGDGDYTGSANFDTEDFNNPVDLDEDFPDLTGDGKVTQADILKGRGVDLDERRSYEKGMFNPGDGADDESFDGHHFKHDVIGAYDDDLTGKSRRGEVYEDSEGEETYHYDEDLHHDRDELHHLERERDHSHGSQKHGLDKHIAALINSMKYDDKRGVGKDDKYRREPGEHFFHYGNGLAESKKMSKRQKSRLLSEAKRELRRRSLNENIIILNPNSIEKKLENKCINTWKRSPGKKGKNSNSDWDETFRIAGIEKPKKTRDNSWGDKLVIKLDKESGCTNMSGDFGGKGPGVTGTLTLVCDGQRDVDSYAFTLNLSNGSKKTVYNQGISNVIKKNEWCKNAGVEEPSGDVEDEFASTGGRETNMS